MLIKEKYKDKIIEITLNGDSIAFNIYSNQFVSCENTPCDQCLFFDRHEPCRIKRKQFFNSEYIEKPLLDNKEFTVLSLTDHKYRYITKDPVNNSLYLFTGKPYLSLMDDGEWIWDCDADYDFTEFSYNNLFKFIHGRENEPYLISDLLSQYIKTNKT